MADITPEILPEEPQLSPAGDGGTVPPASESNPETLTLSEMNQYLGKDFKDKDTALKAMKDTFSYVGKRKEDIAKEVLEAQQGTAREVQQIKENMFYKDNPQYTPYRAAIAKMGSNPEEVVNTPEFKGVFEKAIGHDTSQNLKSVLTSNPRLAASRDNIGKAKEALSQGNQAEAERLATQAVLESIAE